jgi:hypothetical protein
MGRTTSGSYRLLLAGALAPAALGVDAARAKEPPPEGVEAAARLLGAVVEVMRDGAVAADPKAAAEQKELAARAAAAQQDQRQQQIEQQAKQMEQFFQSPLQAELELVRRTCGSLAPEARTAIAAAGDEAVKATSKQFAAWQFGNRDRKKFDGRRMIQEAVMAAVKPHAKPEEFAAYEREQAARLARRERAARTRIVAKLDEVLELSVAQRGAIAADLENRGEAGWIRELDDTGGMRFGNYPPAPDFADACIAPHLDERQRTEWKQWTQQAGWSRMSQHFGWNFDGQSLQPDPWWKP